MRIVKAGLIGFVALVVLIMLFSLLFPSSVRVSRAIDVYADKKRVTGFLKDPLRWPQWYQPIKAEPSPWQPSANGFSNGSSDVTFSSVSDSSIVLITSSGKENQESRIQVIGDGKNGHCTVQWSADIAVKWYPWEKFGSMMYDKMMGAGMEASLQALKEAAENPSP